MMNYRISYGLLALLIGGCGSNDNTIAQSADVLSSSGSGCGVSSTSVAFSTLVTETETIDSGLAVDCPADLDAEIPGPGVSNTGSGSLSIEGVALPVNTAIYELIFTGNSESTSQLTLHDGEYRSLVRAVTNGTDTATRVDWGIYNATVLLDLELVQVGEEGFTGGSFEVASDNSATASNRVSDLFLYTDKDGDKRPTTADEVRWVVSGNVNVSGVAPDWTITLDLTLQDGSSVTGNYSGTFYTALSQ